MKQVIFCFLLIVVVASFSDNCLEDKCDKHIEKVDQESATDSNDIGEDYVHTTEQNDKLSTEKIDQNSVTDSNSTGEDYVHTTEQNDKLSTTSEPELGKTQLRKWTPAPVVEPTLGKPGEMGKPVYISWSQNDLMNEKFRLNQFNLLASDLISLNRSLLDVRLDRCKNIFYPKFLPTTSVVIAFHNEAWSTLFRTVWSIINRSPRSLLEEIILVDDASTRDHLGQALEDYTKKLPVPVHLYRMENRSGLVRSRLSGASHAKGQVITFLDSHCECAEGWLEPLLARIVENRKTVACPMIDVISDKTFEYVTASYNTWGGFNWKLNFKWFHVPQREIARRNYDRTAPLRTPTMAGIFSIDKDYFYELGSYDEGMNIWGGENLEMSFRVWQCGGVLEIIPCSHVGHVFRDKTPYTFPDGVSKTVFHNNARVAEVWMDEWRDFYYLMNPGAKVVPLGDITSRKTLRDRLQCKSFRWYLENIYPETQMPLDYNYLGDIRNLKLGTCLDVLGGRLIMSWCTNLGGNQVFVYTKSRQIISNDNCLDASSEKQLVKLVRCTDVGDSQTWIYDKNLQTLKHLATGSCMEKPNFKYSNDPVLSPCNDSPDQKWIMQTDFKWQSKPPIDKGNDL